MSEMRNDPAQPTDVDANRFLEATRDGRGAEAALILGEHPGLARLNIFTAAAAGDVDYVASLVRDDAALAVATHGKEEWPPLAYACRSLVYRASARRADDLLRVATMLMDAGATANSFTVFAENDAKKMPISVLYHACVADHVALVTLLLERGANTQDGEAIYHAAQLNRRECLDAMLAHGADISSRQQPYGNTPLYFLVGHRDDEQGEAEWFKGLTWLLDHGADPNVSSYASRETPLHGATAGPPKLATVRQLLAHGADVNRPRADGRTPYAIAVRHGNAEIAVLLRAHGAGRDVLLPMEEFLGACLAADGNRARTILRTTPGLLESMTDEDKSAMADAVRQNNGDAIRLMVDLGFQLTWLDDGAGTALHDAAWLGNADLVRLLISLGAPINLRDGRFGSSPLGWAAHGSGCNGGHDDAYLALIDMLIDAGADRAASINRWGEPPEGMASARVATHLRERGFGSPSDV